VTLRQPGLPRFRQVVQAVDSAAVISNAGAAKISVIFLKKIEFAACGF
jgi:hypothetical protein